MPESILILTVYAPHFTVELYESVLKIDLKKDTKSEIRKGVEGKSSLGRTIGKILNMFAPLHVKLSDIGSAKADNAGNVTINLPHHRDIEIPLAPKDATKLVDKLNELIPVEKEKEMERIMERHRLQRVEKGDHALAREGLMTSGASQTPIPQPRGERRRAKRAEREIEEREE
jgi:hypothetical protein